MDPNRRTLLSVEKLCSKYFFPLFPKRCNDVSKCYCATCDVSKPSSAISSSVPAAVFAFSFHFSLKFLSGGLAADQSAGDLLVTERPVAQRLAADHGRHQPEQQSGGTRQQPHGTLRRNMFPANFTFFQQRPQLSEVWS